MATAPTEDTDRERILAAVRRYWGFDTLRPLQEQAIRAGLARRDSLVVMPTGGGKSLCYHVPPVVSERMDIVVSPLISLMKDQVDALRACGYPAAALHTGMTPVERREVADGIAAGQYRLVYVAPERLLTDSFLACLRPERIGAFVIDEAHCISHWGHDFRREYRRLSTLKDRFPRAGLHAFTATATPRVRKDIVEQLRLDNPTVLVGRSDRPNLVYRIIPRFEVSRQVLEVIRRHAGEAVIVYCISRRDTERMASSLRQAGVDARHYHAGMEPEERRRTQDAFASEQLDVVTATVAFGMGIDRSNVRCVVHAAMPKSMEHYHQETGRAGRDGLEAECVLFYSAADAIKWESLIRLSAQEADEPREVIEAMLEKLAHMRRFCGNVRCRHAGLSEYFGDTYDKPSCGACDVCLDEVEGVTDATVTAQKILSCVARVEQHFGVGHVVDVLLGADTDVVRRWGHTALSTHGLMRGTPRKALTHMVYQLLDQGLLARSEGDRPTLLLTDASLEVMRGNREVRLIQPRKATARVTAYEETSWQGVHRGLFEHLREVRRELAIQRGVPAFVILSDVTLRGMANRRPASTAALRRVRGIGERKLADFGARFLTEIKAYCHAHGIDLEPAADRTGPGESVEGPARVSRTARQVAFDLFAEGRSIDEVAEAVQRRPPTVQRYLQRYIETERPESVDAWVDPDTYRKVADAASKLGVRRVRMIHESLNGTVPMDTIRLVACHLDTRE
jgi:ATP-dependent DNA helicase RecQ